MHTIDGAVDRVVPSAVSGSISISEYLGQGAIPGAVDGIAAAIFPHLLARAKVLTRKVAPSDSRPLSVDDCLDYSAVVLKRSGSFAGVRR